jgi:hypothetical protein
MTEGQPSVLFTEEGGLGYAHSEGLTNPGKEGWILGRLSARFGSDEDAIRPGASRQSALRWSRTLGRSRGLTSQRGSLTQRVTHERRPQRRSWGTGFR